MNLYPMSQYLVARKNKSVLSLGIIVFIFFSVLNTSYSQDKLKIVNGDLIIDQFNNENESIVLITNKNGQSKLVQKKTTIESDKTTFYEKKNYAEANGHVYINQNDSIDIYSNNAKYYGNQSRAELIGEVALLQDVFSLQTDRLDYDLKNKIATYKTGGELNDTSTTLTSKIGTYYVDKQEAIFEDSVVLVNPERKIVTQKLTYNLKDKWAYFEGPTTIYEKEQTITTTKGRYNSETGEAELEEQPVIDNGDTYAKADKFVLDQKSGLGEATGNVYVKDKKENSELFANKLKQVTEDEIEARGAVDFTSWADSINLKTDYVLVNQKTNDFFARGDAVLTLLNQNSSLLADSLSYKDEEGIGHAMGRPFLTSIDGTDSIYMVANKMTAIRKIEQLDTLYDFTATKNVLLFKSDFQAKADSAYFAQNDSIIYLFKNPVLWSDSIQLSADTIRIYLQKDGIERVEFRQNCFFIQWVEKTLFNQLRGREIDAYFIDNKIDSLYANGNAETIFMVQDDDQTYVAIDKMKSGKMNVSFENDKINEIFWYNDQEGTTYPFQKTNPDTHRLSGFSWRADERPKSKFDLLSAIGRMNGDFKFKNYQKINDIPDIKDEIKPDLDPDINLNNEKAGGDNNPL